MSVVLNYTKNFPIQEPAGYTKSHRQCATERSSQVTFRLSPMRWFVILAVITIGLALGLPPDPHAVQQLHTSAVAYRVAVAAILIPYVIIWYLSFFAFAKLQEYSRALKGAKDGPAFHKIMAGMGFLAFSLVVPTTVSLVLNDIAAHYAGFKPAAIIINNYLGIIPGMIALLIIYNGTRMLLNTSKGWMEKVDLRWHAPWFLLLSVVFSHLAIENQYRYHPYHLSLWVLVATIIVPYLYAWTVGLMSAYGLNIFARTAPGTVYRQAIKRFAIGISVVIFASIAIQFVNATFGQRLSKSIGILLLVDYILLIIAAVGLGLMASGTKKLKLIEEV